MRSRGVDFCAQNRLTLYSKVGQLLPAGGCDDCIGRGLARTEPPPSAIIADLTNGTGRFNLAQGLAGTFSGVGASLSTSMTGIVTQRFGYTAGLLSVTVVGLMAVVTVLVFMPETKPAVLRRPLGAPISDQE